MSQLPIFVALIALLGANSSSPGVGPKTGTYRLTLALSSETACSRSQASSSTTGTLVLSVGRTTAMLELRLSRFESFGPSFYEYRRGHRTFSRRRWTELHRFDGHVAHDGSTLRLTLAHCKSTNGSVCAATGKQVTLSCASSRVDAYPQKSGFDAKLVGKTEVGRPIGVLSCEVGANAPRELSRLVVNKRLVLRPNAELTLHRHLGFLFRAGRNREFFRAP